MINNVFPLLLHMVVANKIIKSLVFAIILIGNLVQNLPVHSAPLADESGKNWRIKLNALYAYDDNVVQAPRDMAFKPDAITTEDDSMLEWSATADWKHTFNKNLSLRAAYDVDMTIHSKLSEYDLTTQIAGISPTFKISPLMNVMLDYKYIYNIVDGDSFSGIQYLSPSFHYMHPKLGLTRLYYTFQYTDNWKTDLRDNIKHSLGIKQYIFFANYTRRISFGYKYTTEDANGDIYDRDLHTLELIGKTPLFFGVDLEVEAEATFRSYDTRLATDSGLRDDIQHKVYVNLSKVLLRKFAFMENLTAKAQYRYEYNDSDLLLREYRTNRVEVGLEARF
ncbi:MAG: surface lipoprotein assembly modifier [Nitrospinales bacterium]